MDKETEVLIIGAGPTGLMMACQLLRFGIKFILIDKNQNRTHESRAFGIQARSMEIFQNLGILQEFLSRCRVADKVHKFFYSPTNKIICDRYKVKKSGLFFIRPDRYIAFHSDHLNFDALNNFFLNLYFGKPYKGNDVTYAL